MATWYYYDNDGQKHGVFSDGQLKYLAKVGIVTPETLVESEGKTIPARYLKGLEFAKNVQRASNKQNTTYLPAIAELISTVRSRVIPLALLALVVIVITCFGAWWLLLWGWLLWGCIAGMFVIVLTVMEMTGNYTVSAKQVLDWLLSNSHKP